MAWRIRLDPAAAEELKKLDPQIAHRVMQFLSRHLAHLDDPRSIGEALKGKKRGEFWKYRIGDYRIIASIQDSELLILVLRIGNRREVYKQ
jgi:mRNA interferase RelE/StbE